MRSELMTTWKQIRAWDVLIPLRETQLCAFSCIAYSLNPPTQWKCSSKLCFEVSNRSFLPCQNTAFHLVFCFYPKSPWYSFCACAFSLLPPLNHSMCKCSFFGLWQKPFRIVSCCQWGTPNPSEAAHVLLGKFRQLLVRPNSQHSTF